MPQYGRGYYDTCCTSELQECRALSRRRTHAAQDDFHASQHFRKLIETSLSTLMTKINWTAHIMAHR